MALLGHPLHAVRLGWPGPAPKPSEGVSEALTRDSSGALEHGRAEGSEDCGAIGSGWIDRDGSVVVLLATLANADGSCVFDVAVLPLRPE